MTKDNLQVGGRYRGKYSQEEMIYLGYNFSSNGYWHQFALVEKPYQVWAEMLDEDLRYIEETNEEDNL